MSMLWLIVDASRKRETKNDVALSSSLVECELRAALKRRDMDEGVATWTLLLASGLLELLPLASDLLKMTEVFY